MLNPDEILFIGIGKSAVAWYRCYMPAMHMGADWAGVWGEPPNLMVATGLVKRQTALPTWEDYKVVVLQQPYGTKWLSLIKRLQEQGIKVLYEVDDYLHGVRKQKGHDFSKSYNKEQLRKLEMCMRVCDGIIASTEWLGRRYRKFNRNVYVCLNGIDTARYRLTRPTRPTVNIGWAGATGHVKPLLEWLGPVATIMDREPKTCFVAVGQPQMAKPFQDRFGEARSIGIPFTLIENYPAAMTMMDIAIAPAGKTSWYRGKSDLRWLEAGALGVPIIADPDTYPEIEHGVTGYHASTPAEVTDLLATLVGNEDTRERVGQAAKCYIEDHRSVQVAALRWLEVCRSVAGDYESAALVTEGPGEDGPARGSQAAAAGAHDGRGD